MKDVLIGTKSTGAFLPAKPVSYEDVLKKLDGIIAAEKNAVTTTAASGSVQNGNSGSTQLSSTTTKKNQKTTGAPLTILPTLKSLGITTKPEQKLDLVKTLQENSGAQPNNRLLTGDKHYTIYNDLQNEQFVIIPAVSYDRFGKRKFLTDQEAIDAYKETGNHVKKFSIFEEIGERKATEYLKALEWETRKEEMRRNPGKTLELELQAAGALPVTDSEKLKMYEELEYERELEKQRSAFKGADENAFTALTLAGASGTSNAMTGMSNAFENWLSLGEKTGDIRQNRWNDALQQVASEERSEMNTALGIAFDLTQNFAQNAPAMIAGYAGGSGIIGSAVTFAQSYGNDMHYALQAGHDKKKAMGYAFFDGLNQAFFDYLGYLPGVKTVTKTAAETISKHLTSATAKFFGRFGATIGSEALTEAAQTSIENFFKNDILGEKNDASMFSKEALYAAFLGALSAGLMDSVGSVSNAVADRANTVNIGSEYLKGENGHSISEALEIGLSNAKSSDAYRAAQSLQTKVNNGERVSAYEVGRMIAESSTPEAKLAREVERLVLQSAQANGVKTETAEEIAAVASRLGRPVVYASAQQMATKGKDGTVYYETGKYDRQTGVITLNAMATREETVNYVLKHELMHSVERTELGGQLEQIVRSSMGADFDTQVQAKQAEYAERGKRIDRQGAVREVVADWIGKNLYQNGFVQAIVSGNASVGNAFLQTLDKVRLALGGTKKSRTAANIAIVERLFMRALQQPVALESGGGVQSYINPNFAGEYEAWDKKSTGGYFVIGTTSKALESIGINPSKIYWDKSKIVDILNNPTHYMEDAITQVPDLLENPIIIMQSNTVANRVVLLGDVYDQHGNPVLCALELTPRGRIENLVKISSAYGKENGLQGMINESQILYLDPDKKRTDSWLQARRLQLPVGVTNYGPIGRVTLVERNVKGEIEFGGQLPAKTPMQIAFEQAQNNSANTQYMQNGQEYSQSSFYGSDEIASAVADRDTVDYSALEKYDQRTYTNHGWVAVNRVLTGKEQSQLYSQWAQATENGYRYPQTPKGETILTVGDAYGDAHTLVFISGTNQNPIISEVVRIAPENGADISIIRQQLIDGEVQGDVNIRQDVEIVFGQGVFVSKQGSDFAQYSDLARSGANRSSNITGNGNLTVGNPGRGSGQENPVRDSATVNTAVYNESPTSQRDGAGFFYGDNSQSSFYGSDEIASAVAERERAVTAPSDTPPVTASVSAPVIQSEDFGRGESAGSISQAQTVEELEGEIGEEALYRRMYTAAQIDRPPATVEINGREISTTAYMDDLYTALPDDDAQLTAYLKQKEAQKAAELAAAYEQGQTDLVWTETDLQILTARSKLEWGQLDGGEDGKKTRRFYEQRLKGKDTNTAHQQELLELLAGRSETYDPIANATTLERAKKNLLDEEYKTTLRKRILRYKPNDMLNYEDAAAAQVMINDARNAGDLELYADLVQGLSRKGTEVARAVQILSMQGRMTPEGTLKAAQRTLRKQADVVLYDGAGEDIDTFVSAVNDAIERAEEHKQTAGAPSTGQNVSVDSDVKEPELNAQAVDLLRRIDSQDNGRIPMSREELTEALVQDIAGDKSPYITQEEIRGILKRAVSESSSIPEQIRRVLKKKLGSDMGTLAQRIAEIYQAGHLNDNTLRRVVEEALGLPTLSSEDVQTLTRLVNEMNDTEEFSVQRLDATENIYAFLGEKLPMTALDIMQAWRKFAMLFNLRTHLRNFGSNAVYAGVNKMDGAVATLLERVFIKDAKQRTAALGWSLTEQGRQLRPLLEESAERAVLRTRGTGKYELGTGQLYKYRKAFGKSKFWNTLSEKNSQAMDWEDMVFFRPAYIDALGQIMVARGMTEITAEVENKAFDRALETVFRNENAISNGIAYLKHFEHSSKRGARIAGHAVDIVIPFDKTPSNIAMQAAMHSPLGLVKGTYDLVQSLRGKNKTDAATIINEFSKGITGSALLAVGILLGSLGLFVTGYGKTEKERAADELAGIQENAFRFGNVTISMDWLQPSASMLIAGASIAQRLKEDGISLGSVFGAVMDGTDSLFEMTMLQSLYDILGGYDSGATATAGSVVENLVSQSIPTVLGQIARAVDPVQRKTNGTSALSGIIGDGDFAKMIHKVIAKVPGLTYLLEPELDVWGNEVYRTGKATTGNAILNFLQQTVLPANIKTATGDDEISAIMLKLYENAEKEPGRALPSAISRDKAKELGLNYAEANRLLGSIQYAAVEELISDKKKYTIYTTVDKGNGKTTRRSTQKYWSDMTDEERLRVLKRLYSEEKEAVTDTDGEYYKELIRRMG